jgi:AraC family transcriptional activator of mar-sox-rob regulon
MHRLFKHFSGYNLAEYIRARRLSKAAIELRLSHSLVFDIIMEYGFESQQTFTRTFKQHFGISPGQYRDQPHWKFSRLCPPLNLSLPQAPIQTCIRWLPDTHLTGNNYPFRCSFGELVNQREQRDVQIWKEFLHGVKTIPPCVFGLSQSKIAENGRMEYQYSIAVDQMAGSTLPYQEPVELQGGIYLCFIYTGQIPTIKNFIDYIYLTYLPIHEVTRRDGPDIEMYYFNELSRLYSMRLLYSGGGLFVC